MGPLPPVPEPSGEMRCCQLLLLLAPDWGSADELDLWAGGDSQGGAEVGPDVVPLD